MLAVMLLYLKTCPSGMVPIKLLDDSGYLPRAGGGRASAVPKLWHTSFRHWVDARTNLRRRLRLQLYDLSLLAHRILRRNVVSTWRPTHPVGVAGVFRRRVALWPWR